MYKTRIYHNPKCTKSRAVFNILKDSGIEFDTIHYLEERFSIDELREIYLLLSKEDQQNFIRTKEKNIQGKNIKFIDFSIDEKLELIQQYPILLERPLVFHQGRAIISRPSDNIFSLLNH